MLARNLSRSSRTMRALGLLEDDMGCSTAKWRAIKAALDQISKTRQSLNTASNPRLHPSEHPYNLPPSHRLMAKARSCSGPQPGRPFLFSEKADIVLVAVLGRTSISHLRPGPSARAFCL